MFQSLKMLSKNQNSCSTHQFGSCPKLVPEFSCFWAPNFKGDGPQISDPISEITLTPKRTFDSNWSTDLQDYMLKRKKETSIIACRH